MRARTRLKGWWPQRWLLSTRGRGSPFRRVRYCGDVGVGGLQGGEEGRDGVRAVCDATVGPGEGTSEREIRSWAESGRS